MLDSMDAWVYAGYGGDTVIPLHRCKEGLAPLFGIRREIVSGLCRDNDLIALCLKNYDKSSGYVESDAAAQISLLPGLSLAWFEKVCSTFVHEGHSVLKSLRGNEQDAQMAALSWAMSLENALMVFMREDTSDAK